MQALLYQPLLQECKILFELSQLPALCHARSKRGAILADAHLPSHHTALLQKTLGYELIEVPSGEKHKTRETKQQLEDELFKRKLGRDSVIVGLGGGVTTDIAGYVASTYMRGVPLILVPTTLLAMVDASIGGKTGVDTPFGKNLIGSFYLPQAVLIHLPFLKTLPEKERKNGLSEILKYGLIEERAIWDLCQNWEEHLEPLVRASIACKIGVVSRDFLETGGQRRVLNFGHTVGHALELISHFTLSHGEAVGIGCMAESYLSWRLGYLPSSELEKILAVYRKLGYTLGPFDRAAFLEALTRDKKAKGGEPRFVLIEGIGRCCPFEGEYCRPVPRDILESMIDWMHHGASEN